MKKGNFLIFSLAMSLLLAACAGKEAEVKTAEDLPEKSGIKIALSDDGITVDGKAVTDDADAAVYAAHDIVFYLADQGFTYGAGSRDDEHTQSEADAHTVIHITQPGVYRVNGKLSAGQIAVDLGEGAEEDKEAVVSLILDGADITCSVAPAIIFYRVYECGSADADAASETVDTDPAGANIILADGSENTLNGSYVARIYKSYTLNADGTEVIDNKKLHKYDGALYSKMSMNVGGETEGSGILNINAENEGLDSELHLTINSGTINIVSGNDGINTNEDGVSVTTINGGVLNISVMGTTGEGDGIDSNGYLVINGGTVIAAACADSEDAGIDSDCGIYLNGGTVVASGNMLDAIAGGAQNYAVFRFTEKQQSGKTYTLKDTDGKTIAEMQPVNAFRNLIVSVPEMPEGDCTFWCSDTQLVWGGSVQSGGMPQPSEMPDSMENMPSLPDSERPVPPDGEPPEWNGGERPKWENGDRPAMPDGEPPEMPDGKRPAGGEFFLTPGGGMPQDSGTAAAEESDIFSLHSGGNLFAGVKKL